MTLADCVQGADVASLRGVDWSFASAETGGLTHGIHPDPAKFIPQIPRSLIAALRGTDDGTVLDPFCGSGTTLVEAITAGLPCVGIDVNPLAALISRVKTTPLQDDPATQIDSVTANGELLFRSSTCVSLPPIPRVDHWFRPDVQAAIQSVLESISLHAEPDLRDLLRVALSAIMVRVSNQESDTRYAAVVKRVKGGDVFGLFRTQSLTVAAAAMKLATALGDRRPETHIVTADTREYDGLEDGSVGLLITSPPYPNVYEYWLYHKYRMYWLDMDPIAVREREIGARCHYFRRNPLTANDFLEDLKQCFTLFERVLRPGGYACFVLGDSRIRGEHVDNAELLLAAARLHSFAHVETFERTIPAKRKAFNPSIGMQRREKLVILRRRV